MCIERTREKGCGGGGGGQGNYQKHIINYFRCLISWPTTSVLKHGLQLKRLIKTLKKGRFK